jgi:enamine deaminase RidA (YjgF/YER057c/UK114 family)
MAGFNVEHISPDGLSKNPAFTNVICVSGAAKTIYIGEQNANNAQGEVVGKDDLKTQTKQVLQNIRTALQAAGAGEADVIKWTIYLVQGQSLADGFAAFQDAWTLSDKPPVITMLFVAGLANPEYLIGMEAVAVVAA